MSRLPQLLHDPMGPRRWAITGLGFLTVGALVFLFHEASRATSRAMMIVGAAFFLVGIVVEVVLRIRLKAQRQSSRS